MFHALAISVLVYFANAAVAVEHPTLGIFSWNVHYQCGAFPSCRTRAVDRLKELTHQFGAEIVVSIEFEQNASTPLDLSQGGLTGWTPVLGPCLGSAGHAGDTAALFFAPSITVVAGDGGCLNTPGESARAFAVALVKLPFSVDGCPSVCVVGLHAPHKNITNGADVIARVCGYIAQTCAIAAGDWNAVINRSNWPVHQPPPKRNITVSQLWKQIVPSSEPLLAQAPDEESCCYPNSKYFGLDDHVVSNIATAVVSSAVTFPYQMKNGGMHGNDTEEHKPVAVNLTFVPTPRYKTIV
mmetsp:Transcript_117183/g.184329  ORF Transcript_117183/g.184329 Transcript_117183/m.184329 type:complete len:297 (+) Transcript_117183:45-935(+)